MVNRSRKEVKRLTRECCEKWSWSIEHVRYTRRVTAQVTYKVHIAWQSVA